MCELIQIKVSDKVKKMKINHASCGKIQENSAETDLRKMPAIQLKYKKNIN
ncbi:MAG: hypothetical protein QM426_02520 [Euryarchaeota archaeon]|nr:hypothetical protein [Euryarchaeota archaeon]